ncbi:hypothetical protein DITRI_Ditri02bG0082800 [Diplodiscus trichospermus]
MTDYVQEQEMEIEALEAILMDEFKEIHAGESGLSTSNRCFQITLSPQDEDTDQSTTTPVQLALVFSHLEKYPDDPPLLNVKRYGQDADADNAEEEEATQDEVIVPHGEPVTVDTFLVWRERFEAELALERAKLMPESALSAPKEKKLTGRQWFECGRASARGAAPMDEGSDGEDEEDIDFDDDDFEDDEEDMLEHYLAEKYDSSSQSSKRTA